MRPPIIRAGLDRSELICDFFAGGGGASVGLEAALGRPVDIAINHDPEAIAMHAANHPHTRHYCESVWKVDPVDACGGRPVGLAWFSPDCCHFSRAKGTKPVKKEIRGLAWVVRHWARAVRPRVIVVENVEEFETWGPLRGDRPDPAGRGRTFKRWVTALRREGYHVEWRALVAADYGAPTTRRRLYLVARCDGLPISWPMPTHGRGRAIPWRTAAEIIQWTLPCPSIFGRQRPLAEATLARIAEGVRRYVLKAAQPFIAPLTHRGTGRVYSVEEPLRTVTAAHRGEHALVSPTLIQASWGERDGQSPGAELGTPAPTVTGQGQHLAEVRAFLTAYYGSDATGGQDLFSPLRTVTAKDRFGLVMVEGELYAVSDIGMRMLAARELYCAQGFPAKYSIAEGPGGRPLTKTAQVRMAGNSVVPQVAEALARAQLCFEERAYATETVPAYSGTKS